MIDLKKCFLAVVFSALSLQATDADAAVIRCDSCSNQDMIEAATFYGDGLHMVYDIQAERLAYVSVQGWGWQPITFPVPSGVHGHWMEAPPEEQFWFQEIAVHLKSRMFPSGHDVEFFFDEFAIGNVGATAADAVASITLADQVYQRLLSNDFQLRDAGLARMARFTANGIARALISNLGLSEGMEVRVRVRFSNGSSIILSIGMLSGEIVRAETADRVVIPLPGQRFYSGEWNGWDLGYLRDYFNRYFATSSSEQGSGGEGCTTPVVTGVACTTPPGEEGMHCTYTIECR